MNIEMVQINKIKPYENNPRLNKETINEVAKSISEYGFQQPLVLDKSYTIIVGHTRYFAAKKLKLTEIPCVIATDLTEEQVLSYRIADNKTAEFSSWDFLKLNAELDLVPKDLYTGFFESPVFNEIDLEDVINELNAPSKPLPRPKSQDSAPKRTTFMGVDEGTIDEKDDFHEELNTTLFDTSEKPKTQQVTPLKLEVESKPTVYTITVKTTSSERVALMEEAIKAIMTESDTIVLK